MRFLFCYNAASLLQDHPWAIRNKPQQQDSVVSHSESTEQYVTAAKAFAAAEQVLPPKEHGMCILRTLKQHHLFYLRRSF